MTRAEVRAAELNEVSWWALWGEVEWLGRDAYVLHSDEFDEPFFNRAGFLSCRAAESRLEEAEGRLASAGKDLHVTIPESCLRTSASLAGRGYGILDRMFVLKMGVPGESLRQVMGTREVRPRDAEAWCDTYLQAFYGDLALKPRVLPLTRRLTKAKGVTLVVAETGGKVVAAEALFRTPGLLGLYCLGTIPEYRGRGAAHSLVARANEMAAAEGRSLILQALQSEGAEPFYTEAGFERVEVKQLLRKRGQAKNRTAAENRELRFGASFARSPPLGPSLFGGVFRGFERVPAVRGIFGSKTAEVLSELQVEVVDERGYMHINAARGSIVVSAGYLRGGSESHIYLDVIHELVHIRQHMEGRELWDRRYSYVDRPTELEAYRVAVDEARRLGLDDDQIADYLKVEWVSSEDFARFLTTLGVKSPGP